MKEIPEFLNYIREEFKDQIKNEYRQDSLLSMFDIAVSLGAIQMLKTVLKKED